MRALLLSLLFMSGMALADACVVTSRAGEVAVQVCQQNRSIPRELFRSGFCKPELAGQDVEVKYLASCPQGAFGICRNAQASNLDYRQDVHYYGVAGDARFLQPACEAQDGARWEKP